MTIEELARKHGFDKKDNDFSNVMSFARELVEQCAPDREHSHWTNRRGMDKRQILSYAG